MNHNARADSAVARAGDPDDSREDYRVAELRGMDQRIDYGSVCWHLGVVVKPGLSGLADRGCNLTADTGIVQRRGVEVPGDADRRAMMICTDVLKERGGLGVQSVSMCSDRRFGIPSSDETDSL